MDMEYVECGGFSHYFMPSSDSMFPVTVFDGDSAATHPDHCTGGRLFPHQLTSLYRMRLLEQSGPIELVCKPKPAIIPHTFTLTSFLEAQAEADDASNVMHEEMYARGLRREGKHLWVQTRGSGGEEEQEVAVAATDLDDVVAGEVQVQSRVGVLANKPGSGKSAIVLSLCGYPCATDPASVCMDRSPYIAVQWGAMHITPLRANLIVCHPKLIMQWNSYMPWFPTLKHHIIASRQQGPQDWKDMVAMGNAHDVLFVSSSFLWTLAPYFPRVMFQRCFFDEIDSLSYPHTKQVRTLQCHFLWWVTATPEQLFQRDSDRNQRPWQQTHKVLSVQHWLRRNHPFTNRMFAALYTVRCSEQDIDASIVLPPYTLQNVVVRNSMAIQLSMDIVDEQMQYLLRGDRLREVIAMLNVTNETVSGLVDAMRVYLNHRIRLATLQLERWSSQEPSDAYTERKQAIYRCELVELERKKRMVEERLQDCSSCLICCEALSNPVATQCCAHFFCFDCLQEWLKCQPTCPVCRTSLHAGARLITRHHMDAELQQRARASPPPTRQHVSKLQALLHVLQSSTRSLLYVEDVAQAIAAKQAMTDAGIQVLTVAGMTGKQVWHQLQFFAQCTTPTCLMVSSIKDSAGFNLQCVDTIVMYQRMRQREGQIIGRGMRLGRTGPLQVYRIVYECESVSH